MPRLSPKLLDLERRFLAAGGRGCRPTTAAYDAAPDERVQRILELCAPHLDETHLQMLEAMLGGGDDVAYEDRLGGLDEESDKFLREKLGGENYKAFDSMRRRARDAKRAKDSPPPFAGRPTPGGAPLRKAM